MEYCSIVWSNKEETNDEVIRTSNGYPSEYGSGSRPAWSSITCYSGDSRIARLAGIRRCRCNIVANGLLSIGCRLLALTCTRPPFDSSRIFGLRISYLRSGPHVSFKSSILFQWGRPGSKWGVCWLYHWRSWWFCWWPCWAMRWWGLCVRRGWMTPRLSSNARRISCCCWGRCSARVCGWFAIVPRAFSPRQHWCSHCRCIHSISWWWIAFLLSSFTRFCGLTLRTADFLLKVPLWRYFLTCSPRNPCGFCWGSSLELECSWTHHSYCFFWTITCCFIWNFRSFWWEWLNGAQVSATFWPFYRLTP